MNFENEIQKGLNDTLATGGNLSNQVNAQANGSNKKVIFQMNLTEKDRNELKSYFASKGVTMAKGLLMCYRFVENLDKNGKVNISTGGVFNV